VISRKRLSAISEYDVYAAVIAMGLTSVVVALVLEVWRASLNAPFSYRDDSILNLMAVKSVLEGWYLENRNLGAPLGQELYDYPVFSGDHLNLVMFKLLGLMTSEPAAVLNLFFLLTFPLAALTAFVVMRTLGISRGAAVVCSALYALLPYHFLRGETHVFLSAYYAVPLAAYLVLAVFMGKPLFRRRCGRTGALAFASATTFATVGICLVISLASGSFYYSAFAILLLAAATATRAVVIRSARALASGAAAVILILVFSAINLAPVLAYRLQHGSTDAIERQPFESEYYSLRLSQLLLPLGSHRLEPFARVRRTYDRWSESTGVDITEAVTASLGTLGALGFLGLVGALLVSAGGSGDRLPPKLLRAAGAAAMAAFLIATMGGLSSFIGLIYPQLRAWNRLSVFIAFTSVLRHFAQTGRPRPVRPMRWSFSTANVTPARSPWSPSARVLPPSWRRSP
jgi:phosphoglycerol transferase